MARKSFEELANDLLTAFPDNISGLITPLVLRTYLDNFLKAIRPSYGLISRPNPTLQTLGLTDLPLVFDTSFISDVPDYTADVATGLLTRVEAGTTRMTFNATLEGAVNKLITFTIYRNGVPLSWRASASLLGAGKPVDVNINAISFLDAQANYQIQAKADTASTPVTFSNMDFLAETVPVNSY